MNFNHYPKKRPSLPPAYEKIYAEHYRSNRNGETTASGLAQRMESWLHKKVAEDVTLQNQKGFQDLHHFHKTLELGAGTLNQLAYEEPHHYDVVEPFKELFEDTDRQECVTNTFSDIDEISLEEKYDRIISVATLEHIVDLPKVVAKSCLLLSEGGSFRNSIPTEGKFLFKVGWKMTTGLEFRLKHKLDYEVLMKHEHVNTADEIASVLRYFYEENICSFFGLSENVSFYQFYESSKPNLERAEAYLESIAV